MDNGLEKGMDVMTRLSRLYMENEEKEKGIKVALESDKLEEDYNSAYEIARHYRRLLKGKQYSEKSEILTIDLLNRINIDDSSGTFQKQGSVGIEETSKKVGFFNSRDNSHCLEPMKDTNPLSRLEKASQEQGSVLESEKRQSNAGITNLVASDEETPYLRKENQKYCGMTPGGNMQAVPFEPVVSDTVPSIGLDMWRQLKRVEIPTFSGDKKKYQSWKAAFLSCIDSAPAKSEYKLLQLRQYLSGDALRVIDSLRHSATAYDAAKDRLERKYGGRRRQIAIYLEELEQFPQVQHGHAQDIEDFADLLDIAMINLKEAGQDYELRDGSLYVKLQRKLPETMLAQYHRWIFENHKEESVLTLRTWVLQESEFMTIASETVHGFNGSIAYNTSARSAARYGNQRTFSEDTKDPQRLPNCICQECGENLGIWRCRIFTQRSVPDRWAVAKRPQLCFRCLGEGHQGKSCQRSRICRLDRCTDMHHCLLHKHNTVESRSPVTDHAEIRHLGDNDFSKNRIAEQGNVSTNRATFFTEGNDTAHKSTMVAQGRTKPHSIGLRTVPVILLNKERSLRVNALLDDASTKTYVNANIAKKIGLQGRTEKVNVSVLNGHVETLVTKSIDVTL